MANAREKQAWTQYAKELREQSRPLIDLSKESDLPYSTGNPKRLSALIKNLDNVEDVLEIGSGGGHWTPLFEGKNYLGLEQNDTMLTLAKFLNFHSFKQGNARNLKFLFKENSFDLVFSSAVLQHNNTEPDKNEILEGINYITKIGGYLLMIENTLLDKETDGLSFSKQGWINYIINFGFTFILHNKPEEYLFRRTI